MSISVNDEYREEKECVYKGRRYIVRDNGAVMRLSDSTGRKTKNDGMRNFTPNLIKKDSSLNCPHEK